MLPYYGDIIDRIEEEPIWYDQNGVPRYEKFKPDLAPNIYADEVILLEIACQDCGRKFLVEMNWEHTDLYLLRHSIPNPSFSEVMRGWLKTDKKEESWPPVHYGDPPSHGCVGDTMNVYDLRILEFWRKENFDWARKTEFELELERK
jgi:hypothetical protein